MNIESDFLQQGYPVFSGKEALQRFRELLLLTTDIKRVFVLCDANTAVHCLPVLKEQLPDAIHLSVFSVEAGEDSKSLSVCETIWKEMTSLNVGRKDVLLNLGGGVVGDIGGFVAASYLRGISFVNIPTSLMAMVDAALGGKNGVDLAHHKNRIGSFYFPIATICDPVFLASLPETEWKNGCAEVFKHALIGDKDLWSIIAEQGCTRMNIFDLLQRIQSVKLNIVDDDPYEDGFRKVLNFGHTVGHAIESASLKQHPISLTHGEAVAMGMIVELEIAVLLNMLEADQRNEARAVLEKQLGQVNISRFSEADLLDWMRHDKKNANGSIRMSLLTEIGRCAWDVEVPEEVITRALRLFL